MRRECEQAKCEKHVLHSAPMVILVMNACARLGPAAAEGSLHKLVDFTSLVL